MYIDTKLSSASTVDEGNNLKGFDYINAFGGHALILTFVVSLTTYFSCCCKKTTSGKAQVRNKIAMNVVGSDDFYPTVTESNSYRQSPLSIPYLERQTRSRGTAKLSQTAALPRPRGLENNGNTCYFNSVMQALTQTLILENQLGEIRELGDMTQALARFYASVHNTQTSSFNPQGLQRLMIERTGKFRFGKQHDSHECLLSILHELRKDERQGRTEKLTVVDKIFGGHCMTVYQCKQCHTPSHLCEPFLDISLPICFGEPRTRRKKAAAKRPKSSISHPPMRPLPTFVGVEQENSQQSEASEMDKRDIDIKVIEGRNGKRQRKKQSDDAFKEGNRDTKIQKIDQHSSRFTASESTQRETRNDSDPILTEKYAYKRAVVRMMRTSLKGAEPNDLSTLEDCLQCYTRKELITDEYLCRECNSQSETESDIQLTSATKQTVFLNPPAVLTIHLKRFENTGKEYIKRSMMIHYDEVLNIGSYCSSWHSNPPSRDIWYTLYAVVVHFGSLKSGHYIAYGKVRDYDKKFRQFLQKSYLDRDSITVESLIQKMNDLKPLKNRPGAEPPSNKEGTWYCMNDCNVSAVSAQEVLNQEAFLLFYERL